ncbi:MAG TPA: flagellar motor protein MotB [Acidisarcina sp.]|nr:flagellar motor protein MotB [Acidisarcina sp.]
MEKQRPIYLIRRRALHDSPHGGAWKVAYADFVTALMALFIVLWLMNTSEHVRKAVAGYFNDPLGRSSQTGTDRTGASDNVAITKDNISQLKEQLQKSIREKVELRKLSDQIEITVTPEGLRIELLESKDGTFFESGSSELSTNGREILALVSGELKTLPNKLSIEGHTDSQAYAPGNTYGNWELSVDRANSARRSMQEMGIRRDQVAQVRGYADQRLRVPSNPLDPSNRRISLIVQYLDAPPVPTGSLPTAPAATVLHH